MSAEISFDEHGLRMDEDAEFNFDQEPGKRRAAALSEEDGRFFTSSEESDDEEATRGDTQCNSHFSKASDDQDSYELW